MTSHLAGRERGDGDDGDTATLTGPYPGFFNCVMQHLCWRDQCCIGNRVCKRWRTEFTKMGGLTNAVLCHNWLTDQQIHQIITMEPNLINVTLACALAPRPRMLTLVTSLKRLTCLTFTTWFARGLQLEDFQAAVRRCAGTLLILDMGLQPPVDMFRLLGGFSVLHTLVMSGVHDRDLPNLGDLPSLKCLHLTHCTGQTTTGLETTILACPNLERLDLSGNSELTDAGLTSICRMLPGLQALSLVHCLQITEEGIHHMDSRPEMRTVWLTESAATTLVEPLNIHLNLSPPCVRALDTTTKWWEPMNRSVHHLCHNGQCTSWEI
jgi:hypothetical protein